MKTAARKYASCNKVNIYITGGGASTNMDNVVYDKVLEILNKKTVVGLDNPYDDDGNSSGIPVNYENINVQSLAEEDTSTSFVSSVEIVEGTIVDQCQLKVNTSLAYYYRIKSGI